MAVLGPSVTVATVGPSSIRVPSFTSLFLVIQSPFGTRSLVTMCSSFAEFVKLFGGLNRLATLGGDGAADTWGDETDDNVVQAYYSAKAYFDEKGPAPGVLYVVRVTSVVPTLASRNFPDAGVNNTAISSKWHGAPGGATTVTIANNTTYVVITLNHAQAGITEQWKIVNATDAANASRLSQLATITLPAGGQLPVAVASPLKIGNGTPGTADDYAATTTQYVGTSTGAVKTGLRAFDDLRYGTGFVAAPSIANDATWRTGLVTHVNDYFRIGLVSASTALTQTSVTTDQTGIGTQSQLAYYWPRLRVPDEQSEQGGSILVTNEGALAGLHARMAYQYNGPHKSAAGVDHAFRSIIDVESQASGQELTDDAGANTLADSFINTLRRKRGTIVSWGLRTLASDETFRQVPARWTTNVVYHALIERAERYSFEPITDELMARATSEIKGFLKRLHRDNVLYGKEPGATPSKDDAYQVVCDRSNNTPETVGAGELRIDVLIVPTLNAEQVRLRLQVAAPGFAKAPL